MSDGLRPLAVVDIDGVLADVRHRLHHLERRPKDWRSFFAAAPQDPLLEVGRATVVQLAEVCEVVYLSGRPEHCRRDTEAWFAVHGLPPGELLLRAIGDARPAKDVRVSSVEELALRAMHPAGRGDPRGRGSSEWPALWRSGR